MRRKFREEFSSAMIQSEKLRVTQDDDEFLKAFAAFRTNSKQIEQQNEDAQQEQHERLTFEEKKTIANREGKDGVYYDFYQINEKRRAKLIEERVVPKASGEMEKIRKLNDENYVSKKDKAKIDPAGESEEKVKDLIHPLAKKHDLYEDDDIVAYSVTGDPTTSKLIGSLPIYRDLAPIAREISCAR